MEHVAYETVDDPIFQEWLDEDTSELSGSLAIDIDGERKASASVRRRRPMSRRVPVFEPSPVPAGEPARVHAPRDWLLPALIVSTAVILTSFAFFLSAIVAATAILAAL